MECSNCSYIIAVVAVVTILYLVKKWWNSARCHSTARLDGKTVVITGANTGIGKETAIDLAKRGGLIVMACRDKERGEAALKEVKERSGSSQVFLKILDLASLASVREFCQAFLVEYTNLHILINNAGVFMCPYTKTKEGFEMQIGVNHFGHFALTNLLLKRMVESAPSRVINVSSGAHTGGTINFDDINSEKSYGGWAAYGQSKLANVLFTKELHHKVERLGVTSYALHPGAIVTDVLRHLCQPMQIITTNLVRVIGKSIEEGAQTTIYCAVQEGIESQSGMYFSDCALKKSSKISYDEGVAKKLWEMSEQMTDISFPL